MPWLSAEAKGARLVRQGLERLRRKIPLIGRQRIYDAMVDIRRIMKEPGEKPTYPIKWDSIKQRKAFFASKGTFIKDYSGPSKIPTRRTGEYQKAWTILKVGEQGYDIGNPLAHSRYLSGTARSGRAQSRIHRGRWNLFKDAIDKVVSKLPKQVRESLKLTARQAGFRTKD